MEFRSDMGNRSQHTDDVDHVMTDSIQTDVHAVDRSSFMGQTNGRANTADKEHEVHVRTLLKQIRDMNNTPYDILSGATSFSKSNQPLTVGQFAYQYLYDRWLRKKNSKRHRAQQRKLNKTASLQNQLGSDAENNRSTTVQPNHQRNMLHQEGGLISFSSSSASQTTELNKKHADIQHRRQQRRMHPYSTAEIAN